jgi:predicted nucleotide-binding protein
MADQYGTKRSAHEVELARVKSLIEALEEQDNLLNEGIKNKQILSASMPQLIIIRGIFEDILNYQPKLIRPFHLHADANGLRSQIRDARLKVVARYNELALLPQTDEAIMTRMEHPATASEAADKRRVFVVHGRNLKARDAMFAFLRAVDLDPIEWEEAIKMTSKGTPHPEEVLRAAFSNAQAGVILMTGDDLARLGKSYLGSHDSADERRLTPQARPNVLFEAGMAWGRFPERTIIVALGHTRDFSDLVGLHIVQISNAVKSRQALADRLKTARCLVKTDGRTSWHEAGDFDSANHPPDLVEAGRQAGLKVIRRTAQPETEATHKPKVRVEIRNDGSDCVEVRNLVWNSSSLGIKVKFAPNTLQLRLGDSWCPESKGVERLHLPPGETCRTWIQPADQHDMNDLEQRCQSEGRIGTLSILVDNVEIQMEI